MNYTYSLMGKMGLSFIDSDLLYRGAFKAGLTVLYNYVANAVIVGGMNKYNNGQLIIRVRVMVF